MILLEVLVLYVRLGRKQVPKSRSRLIQREGKEDQSLALFHTLHIFIWKSLDPQP